MLSFNERAGGFTGLKHRHHGNHIVPRKIVRGQIIIDMRAKIFRIEQIEIIGQARGLLSICIVVYFLEIRGKLVGYVFVVAPLDTRHLQAALNKMTKIIK